MVELFFSKRLPAPARPAVPPADAASRPAPRAGRRLAGLAALLAVAAGAYAAFIGLPRWRSQRYGSAALPQLGIACAQGSDLSACTALARRAIAESAAERAITPLREAWERVQRGEVRASTQAKAELIGNLALVSLLSERIEEARPLYMTAVQLSFEAAPGHLAYAFDLVGQGAEQRALHELQVVTTIDPRSDLAWFLTGHIYNQNNYLEKGRDAVRRAIAINPNVASYWQELGDSFAYAGQYERALEAYLQEQSLAPASIAAQSDVARAKALSAKTPEQYREAVGLVEAVLKKDPSNPESGYSLLGELQLQFGKYEEARRLFEKALTLDPTIPERHYKLSQARRLAGDARGAAAAMRRYKELYGRFQRVQEVRKQIGERPNDPRLHLELARAWEQYKAWPQAAHEHRETLRLQPGQPVRGEVQEYPLP